MKRACASRQFPFGLLGALALWFGPSAVQAATISWRGGTDEFFDTAANWNLPDDIPAGTPAAQLENFRRVPGSQDTAVFTSGAGETVRVRDRRTVDKLEGVRKGSVLTIDTEGIEFGRNRAWAWPGFQAGAAFRAMPGHLNNSTTAESTADVQLPRER